MEQNSLETNTAKYLVCVFNRATYVRCASFINKLSEYSEVTVCLSSSVLDKDYGEASTYIEKDLPNVKIEKFQIDNRKSTNTKIADLIGYFDNFLSLHSFNCVFVVADRFETLAPAIAASVLNIPICHIQGGEVTGNIDEKVRHAVTKLSDYHFVSTVLSKDFVIKMGEDVSRVFLTGCPAIDMIKGLKLNRKTTKDKIILCQFHPHTLDVEESRKQLHIVLEAVVKFCVKENHTCYLYYPNVDPGRDQIVSVIDQYLKQFSFLFVKVLNENPKLFLEKLSRCSFIIGNSSATIRESSYLGVPAINIGSRQGIRERSLNVIDIEPEKFEDVMEVMYKQFYYKTYQRSFLFGTGMAAKTMVDRVALTNFKIKGPLTYPYLSQFNYKYFGQGRTNEHRKRDKFKRKENDKAF